MINYVLNNFGKIDGNGNQASFDFPQGIYFDISSQNLLIADSSFYSIRKMNQSGMSSFSNLSLSALLSSHSFLSLSLFIPMIFLLNLNDNKQKGYTLTIAGSGTQGTRNGQGTLAQFWNPYCITMDSIGNIYVGDYCAIRMINTTGL